MTNKQGQYDDFNWDIFCKNCLLNKYALVIGSEVIMNPNFTGSEINGNSLKYLFDITLRQLASEDTQPDIEYKSLKSKYADFSALSRKFANIKPSVFIPALKKQEDGFRSKFEKTIDPNLFALLKTNCFRLVLTTAIDPLLEFAMEKVWGKNGFDIVYLDDSQKKDIVYNEYGEVRPTLCYIFGKAWTTKGDEYKRFVLSENDAMETITNWIETQQNNNFLKYLRNYNLLSIGCQYDNWLFRFFWHLLRGKIFSTLNEKEKSKEGLQVAVEITSEKVIHEHREKQPINLLLDYLEQENITFLPKGRDFMKKASQEINKANKKFRIKRKPGQIFITYSHVDRYIAHQLYERLTKEHFDVWLDDEKLDSGSNFKREIENALNQCKVFIPLLSTTIMKHIESGKLDKQWYYKNEWCPIDERYKEAIQEKEDGEQINEANPSSPYKPRRIFIHPLPIGKYQYQEDYHQETPFFISKTTALGDLEYPTVKDKVDHIISMIRDELGKKE